MVVVLVYVPLAVNDEPLPPFAAVHVYESHADADKLAVVLALIVKVNVVVAGQGPVVDVKV